MRYFTSSHLMAHRADLLQLPSGDHAIQSVSPFNSAHGAFTSPLSTATALPKTPCCPYPSPSMIRMASGWTRLLCQRALKYGSTSLDATPVKRSGERTRMNGSRNDGCLLCRPLSRMLTYLGSTQTCRSLQLYEPYCFLITWYRLTFLGGKRACM